MGPPCWCLKGNPEGITSFEGLAGKNVGCEKGTTQADALAGLNELLKSEGKPEMTISEFPDQPAALLAVQSGKVVCDLTDSSTGGFIALTTDDGATFEIVVDPNPPVGWETQPDGIAVLKSNTGLRDAIQQALQQLMDDGTYKTISITTVFSRGRARPSTPAPWSDRKRSWNPLIEDGPTRPKW